MTGSLCPSCHRIHAMLHEVGALITILVLQPRKLSSEKLSNLRKVTQRVSRGGWAHTQLRPSRMVEDSGCIGESPADWVVAVSIKDGKRDGRVRRGGTWLPVQCGQEWKMTRRFGAPGTGRVAVLLIDTGKAGGGAGLGLDDRAFLEADLLTAGHLGRDPVQ